MKTYRVRVFGRVQGVGYRWFVANSARTWLITGTVKNCYDGSVEALLQGKDENCLGMIEEMKKGPWNSRVDDIHIDILESGETCSEFHITG